MTTGTTTFPVQSAKPQKPRKVDTIKFCGCVLQIVANVLSGILKTNTVKMSVCPLVFSYFLIGYIILDIDLRIIIVHVIIHLTTVIQGQDKKETSTKGKAEGVYLDQLIDDPELMSLYIYPNKYVG